RCVSCRTTPSGCLCSPTSLLTMASTCGPPTPLKPHSPPCGIEPCAPRDVSQTGPPSPWFSSSHRPLRKLAPSRRPQPVAKADHRRKVHRRHRSRQPTPTSRLTPTVTKIPQYLHPRWREAVFEHGT